MAFESGHYSDLLVHEMSNAKLARASLDLRFVHDSYSDYVADNTFNHLPSFSDSQRQFRDHLVRNRAGLLRALAEAGKVVCTNRPHSILKNTPVPGFIGRDHKKIVIVDDFAYIGGLNLTPLDMMRVDLMLGTNNPAIVNVLAQVFISSFYEHEQSDRVISCDSYNSVLIDSGKRNSSLIMDFVRERILSGEDKITLLTPYLPVGQLRHILNHEADKGRDIEVITSSESNLGFAPRFSRLVHNFGQQKPKFRITRYPGVVHAKALKIGNHTAIIGSHNFDELFVRFGTEEIALLTSQPEILQGLETACHKLRNNSIHIYGN
jgi:phosphatidylserine/phosphatidylglycerophosphate/cardiolipin synthase-like enzyme